MTRVGERQAKANERYGQADHTTDADERLGFVLRALELEMEADALERVGKSTHSPSVIYQFKDGGEREQA